MSPFFTDRPLIILSDKDYAQLVKKLGSSIVYAEAYVGYHKYTVVAREFPYSTTISTSVAASMLESSHNIIECIAKLLKGQLL